MTLQQLKSIMKYHLRHFNDEDATISNETVHDEVLDPDDGFGRANSKDLYKAAVRWSLAREGHEDVRWPADWMDRTVNELAPRLLGEDE